jgi:pyridoxamine 5'-phosphate oxidase
MNTSIADIRKDYKLESLNESDVALDPITQFGHWWEEALKSDIDEVNAMTLATATADGKPSARIVLLKGYTTEGFIFFTNYLSDKGQQIAENPFACLVFFWKELERQVKIEGSIEKISEADSDEYFHSRPAGSRIGAWASPQSRVIESRATIETNVKACEAEFGTENIPRPAHWGGYIVKPQAVEFWQGRSSRLHDRIRYRLEAGAWLKERLAP